MRRLGSRVTVWRARGAAPTPRGLRHRRSDPPAAGRDRHHHLAHVDLVSGRSGDRVALPRHNRGSQEDNRGLASAGCRLGKTPNTNGIRLECAGVELTSSGYVSVNDRRRRRLRRMRGRLRGKPAFHPYGVRRFPYRQGQSPRKEAQHHGAAGAILSVYRTRRGAHRTERGRRQTVRARLSATELPISSILRTLHDRPKRVASSRH